MPPADGRACRLGARGEAWQILLRLDASVLDYAVLAIYFLVVLGMLVFGVLMIVWALQRPVVPEPRERRGRGSGRLCRAPS
jgi:hypothetical protein